MNFYVCQMKMIIYLSLAYGEINQRVLPDGARYLPGKKDKDFL